MPERGEKASGQDIKTMAWEELVSPQLPTGEVGDEDTRVPVVYGGASFELELSHYRFPIAENLAMETYMANVFRGEENLVHSGISITDTNGVLDASVLVQRFDNEEAIKGLGKALYTKWLDFLQTLANERGVPIVHFVRKVGTMDETKWRKVFGAIVEPLGYVNCENDAEGTRSVVWKKEYKPVK